MIMEDLYLGIYDVSSVPVVPGFRGFSYGMLIMEKDQPACCMIISEHTDARLRFLLERGAIEIQSLTPKATSIYYGYVTDEMLFYCEEKLFPKENGDAEPGESSL